MIMAYTRDDVEKIAQAIGGDETLGDIELSDPHTFGLGLEVYDVASGQIITVARPHRADKPIDNASQTGGTRVRM